ncbi:hypothetical protein LTR95_001864 [Oleoguttula sp. CCFEE 5521]
MASTLVNWSCGHFIFFEPTQVLQDNQVSIHLVDMWPIYRYISRTADVHLGTATPSRLITLAERCADCTAALPTFDPYKQRAQDSINLLDSAFEDCKATYLQQAAQYFAHDYSMKAATTDFPESDIAHAHFWLSTTSRRVDPFFAPLMRVYRLTGDAQIRLNIAKTVEDVESAFSDVSEARIELVKFNTSLAALQEAVVLIGVMHDRKRDSQLRQKELPSEEKVATSKHAEAFAMRMGDWRYEFLMASPTVTDHKYSTISVNMLVATFPSEIHQLTTIILTDCLPLEASKPVSLQSTPPKAMPPRNSPPPSQASEAPFVDIDLDTPQGTQQPNSPAQSSPPRMELGNNEATGPSADERAEIRAFLDLLDASHSVLAPIPGLVRVYDPSRFRFVTVPTALPTIEYDGSQDLPGEDYHDKLERIDDLSPTDSSTILNVPHINDTELITPYTNVVRLGDAHENVIGLEHPYMDDSDPSVPSTIDARTAISIAASTEPPSPVSSQDSFEQPAFETTNGLPSYRAQILSAGLRRQRSRLDDGASS